MTSDSSMPTSVASSIAPRPQPERSMASTSRKPSGAYPTTLVAMSKPVQYGGGSGASRKTRGSMPWARQQPHRKLGVHPAIAGAPADAVTHPQPQAQRQRRHGQQRGKAQKLACHEQQAVALGGRARRHHRQIDEDARQIEKASKPAGHEDYVKGFD